MGERCNKQKGNLICIQNFGRKTSIIQELKTSAGKIKHIIQKLGQKIQLGQDTI